MQFKNYNMSWKHLFLSILFWDLTPKNINYFFLLVSDSVWTCNISPDSNYPFPKLQFSAISCYFLQFVWRSVHHNSPSPPVNSVASDPGVRSEAAGDLVTWLSYDMIITQCEGGLPEAEGAKVAVYFTVGVLVRAAVSIWRNALAKGKLLTYSPLSLLDRLFSQQGFRFWLWAYLKIFFLAFPLYLSLILVL